MKTLGKKIGKKKESKLLSPKLLNVRTLEIRADVTHYQHTNIMSAC